MNLRGKKFYCYIKSLLLPMLMLYRRTEGDYSYTYQSNLSCSTLSLEVSTQKKTQKNQQNKTTIHQTWVCFSVLFHFLLWGKKKREIGCLFPIPQLHNWQWVTDGWLFPSIIHCGEADTVIPSIQLLGKPPQCVNFHYTVRKGCVTAAKELSCKALNIFVLF